MRGFGFLEHGGPDRLGWVEIPEPALPAGSVAVSIRAAAFNRLDRFVLEGIPGVPVERPHVLGSDGAGVVAALGEGVGDLRVGDPVVLNPGLWDASCPACQRGEEALCRDYRILGEHQQGTITETVVVPRRNLHPKPAALGFPEAAAVALPFQTAWRALTSVGGLTAGQTVAIIGAGGSVAPAAAAIALARGARTVVLSRHPEKLERARQLGPLETLEIPPDGRFDRALWGWSGKRGVDLVFDSVGQATLPFSLRAVARGGRVVVVGATTGPEVTLDVRTLFWRQASIRGSTMAGAREFAEMFAEVSAGRLRPIIDSVYRFDEAAEAFDRFAGPEPFGKVVLRRD